MGGNESFAASTIIDVGVGSAMLAGETESGDLHLVHAIEGGVLVAVVDALGHGSEAAVAAACAIAAAKTYGHEPVLSVLQRCHAALIGGRGVVMSLAAFNVETRTMTWIGVGNVEAFLLPTGGGTEMRQSLVTRGGIVGSE
ncbi:MAG: SpoIIE family protein phosphatase, partial [Gemmatimonadales bacterium]